MARTRKQRDGDLLYIIIRLVLGQPQLQSMFFEGRGYDILLGSLLLHYRNFIKYADIVLHAVTIVVLTTWSIASWYMPPTISSFFCRHSLASCFHPVPGNQSGTCKSAGIEFTE